MGLGSDSMWVVSATRSGLRGSLTLMVAVAGTLLLSASAQAIGYTDVIGTNYSFTSISETSTYGDPLPLFDQPIGVGDQLLFFPPDFSAEASGDGGFDQTGAALNLTISSNNTATTAIKEVLLTEFGDTFLTGVGTATTGTFITMTGDLTVTEQAGVAIAPVIINWTGVFTPGDFLGLPGDVGTTLWTGSVLIDVEGIVPNATKAILNFDNELFASSEAGTSAKIQKKVVSGPAVKVKVIPEPGTGLLVGLGIGILGLKARR